MKNLHSFLARLKNIFRRDAIDRDMREQIEQHLALMTEENIALGMDPKEARYAALRKFGGIEQIKEQAREERSLVWLEQLSQDVRYGVRRLIKSPGFALTCIFTIALGIGACTSIFSVADKYLRNPLDYEDADQVSFIRETTAQSSRLPTTPGFLHAWQTQTTLFSDVAGNYNPTERMQMTDGDRAVPIGVTYISPNYLHSLRLRLLNGREFSPEEYVSGKSNVVLISRWIWENQFGRRSNVGGEMIHLNDQPYTVVGVFDDPLLYGGNVMLPGALTAETDNFRDHRIFAYGRLKPGATLAQAQAELDVIIARVAATHPAQYKGRGATVHGLAELMRQIGGPLIWPLVGAVGLLMLIACVNVANLLLLRASARRREIGVRLALGARRGRLIRQLLTESLLLSVAGGALGVFLAWNLVGPLATASLLPRASRVVVDGGVLAASFGLILLTTLGTGLMPALQATSGNLTDALNDGGYQSTGGRRQRVRSALVVLQVACAFVLLVGTGLMARSLQSIQQFDHGLDAHSVYAGMITLDSRRLYDSPEKITAFTRSALERLQALPDVTSAAFANGLPYPRPPSDGFILEGQSRPGPLDPVTSTDVFAVTPTFFRALGIPLISGRELTNRDGLGAAPVVVINQEMARKYFPGQNPVGRQILLLSDKTWSEIVGVVGDVRDPVRPLDCQLYRPIEAGTSRRLWLSLKVTHFSPGLTQAVQATLAGLDPAIAPSSFEPLEQRFTGVEWRRLRFNFTLMGLFSGFALLLATLGIFGVTAYAVAQRTREIGIRIALGAAPRDILHLVLHGGVRTVGIGILLGIGAAFASTQLLNALLYGMNPYDPVTFAGIAVILAVISLIACLFPARRAARVDPMTALRAE